MQTKQSQAEQPLSWLATGWEICIHANMLLQVLLNNISSPEATQCHQFRNDVTEIKGQFQSFKQINVLQLHCKNGPCTKVE